MGGDMAWDDGLNGIGLWLAMLWEWGGEGGGMDAYGGANGDGGWDAGGMGDVIGVC